MKPIHRREVAGSRVFCAILFILLFAVVAQAAGYDSHSSINLRNKPLEGLNELHINGIDDPIIMNGGNNLTSSDSKWEFVSLGKRKGIDYIQSIPEDGYTNLVAVTPQTAYVARYPLEYRSTWGTRYCYVAIYCKEYDVDKDNLIIGCHLDYIPDFTPKVQAASENPFEHGYSMTDGNLADWYVKIADTNHDGVISEQERYKVVEINERAKGLTSLQYLYLFPNLQKLDMERNEDAFVKGLFELKVEHSRLQELYLEGLEVGTLNLLQCKGLRKLYLGFSKIRKILLPESLESLVMVNGEIGELNLSWLPDLTTLKLVDMKLDRIDLSHNTKLTSVILQNNKLTQLDVSMLPHLRKLACDGNNISELDISRNPELQEIQIIYGSSDTPIKTLYIPAGKTKRDYQGFGTGTLARFSGTQVLTK